ncbi:MAG: ankyrin repeat domain-containing protein [Gammaproteobacteria bacterium]
MKAQDLVYFISEMFKTVVKADPRILPMLPDLKDMTLLDGQLTEFFSLLTHHGILQIDFKPKTKVAIKNRATPRGFALLANYGDLTKNIQQGPLILEPFQLKCAPSESEEVLEILLVVFEKLFNPATFNTFFDPNSFVKTSISMTAGLLCALVTRITAGMGIHSHDDIYTISTYTSAYEAAFKVRIDATNWARWELRIYQLLNLMRPDTEGELAVFDSPSSPFYGSSPLYGALKNPTSNDNTTVTMIAQGAHVNSEDSRGETPLNLAITEGRGESVIRALLDNGANINTLNMHGYAPLHLAIKCKRLEIVTLLLNQKDIHASILDGASRTALYYAVNINQPDLVAQLSKRGVTLSNGDIHFYDSVGITLLHTTIAHGMDELSFLLIERGANCNATTYKGHTPLGLAIMYKKRDIALALMNHGARLSSQDMQIRLDDTGLSSLHLAADMGLTDAIQQMIKHGMDITATDIDGNNSLHHAVMSGVKKTSLVLLKAPRIDVALSHQNNEGKTPREYAAEDMDIAHDPALLSKFFTAKNKKC